MASGEDNEKVQGIYRAPRQHWVGDGFPVRSMFSYQNHGKQLSPFLLLDYAGPMDFTPTTQRRGLGNIHIVVLKRSPSFITVKSNTAIQLVTAVSLVRVMCNG